MTGEQMERAHAAAVALLPRAAVVTLIVTTTHESGSGSSSTILAPQLKEPGLAQLLRDCAAVVDSRPPDAML